ncbi:protein kinase domain-containing protein [Frankia sp. CiP1_Cm_nod1]|uniref:protein kinase domain-containing protein n=1 Tax=Frankia sp. CiP1_Cm_nod1 TaxID=2897160 RepID=UPI0040451334
MLAKIGEGGMGSVYLSRTRGNQPVALKVIRREYAQDAEFRRRFEQEIRSARRVQGYHIVPVVDHDTTGTLPWLATIYVPGLSLDQALAAYGPLPLPTALQLTGCAAEALRAVHAAGVIHRDLKPGNILLGSQGPWVIDFGIARAADATQLTRSGGVVGTPQYMSPEHANGQPLTPATDIFSLGLIAAVTATNRHPYGEGAAYTLGTKIANTEFRPPDLSGYPEPLRSILERCLAADPALRPTPAELAELCEAAYGWPLRDFAGWLPDPLATEITRREQASLHLPEPEVPPAAAGPGYETTYIPQPSQHPTQQPQHGSAPAGQSAPKPAPTRGRRTPLLLSATVLAVIVAVAATWKLAGGENKSPEATGGSTSRNALTTSQSQAPSAGPTDAAAETTSQTATATDHYTVIFESKSLIIRAPSSRQYSDVNLDIPKITPRPGYASGDQNASEIEYADAVEVTGESGSLLTFLTPTGKSDGTTPQACKSGAETNVLQSRIVGKDLATMLPKNTVLCTLTTDDNLAMVKIINVVARGDTLDFITEATLWKIS